MIERNELGIRLGVDEVTSPEVGVWGTGRGTRYLIHDGYLLSCCILLFSSQACASEPFRFWIAGTDGVTLADVDPQSGELTEITEASTESLTWIARANNRFLFAGSTLPRTNSKTDGVVCSFFVRDDHSLELVNRVPAQGKTTIYVAADPTARALFAVNFRRDTYPSRGSVVAFAVRADGRIGTCINRFEHPGKGGSQSERQLASHPHSIVVGPDGVFAAVADLGVDRVLIYRILPNAKGLHLAAEIVGLPGQQPRHLAWHPDGQILYCMNEAHSTVSVIRFDRDSATGEFIQHAKRIQGKGGGGADLQVDSQGRFVYGTNRGEDTIVAFRVNQQTGELRVVGHTPTGGPSTRSIAITPDNRWLIAANQGSNEVKAFAISADSGRVKETRYVLTVNQPSCVLFTFHAKHTDRAGE